MLTIAIPESEQWNEVTLEFVPGRAQTLQLEHSLVSLSKWESKWNKPFISKTEKTYEETIDYIKFMTLTQNVDPDVYLRLTQPHFLTINEYIALPMTATYISNDNEGPGSREQVTAELIYYWMIALNIPFECQKWHLNRLLTLIKVCNRKNTPPKKRSRNSIMRRNSSLNASRRKQYGTHG